MKTVIRLVLLCLSPVAIVGQGASASGNIAGQEGVAVPVARGQAVALNGSWKFHVGDDPRWAEVGFDDSQWEQFELAPDNHSLTPEQALELAEFPGWQSHGHPRYAGYGWYRIRLNLEPASTSLALLMPLHVQDGYQVFLNGRRIGGFGKLDGFHKTYENQALLFAIPREVSTRGGPATLAIRFWNEPWESLPGQPNLDGGLRGVPLIGPSALLEVYLKSVPGPFAAGWVTQDLLLGYQVQPTLYLGIGLISIFLFLFSREQQEYLWTGVALIGRGLLIVAIFMVMGHQISNQLSEVAQQIALWASVLAMPLAAMYLLGVPRSRWRKATFIVFGLFVAQGLGTVGIALSWLSPDAMVSSIFAVLSWVPRTSLGILLLLVAVDGIRTIGRKALPLMIPGVLFAAHMVIFMFIQNWDAGLGVLDHVLSAGVPISVLFIFLVRFTKQQRENGRMLADMLQAQEVQTLLISRRAPSVPGWQIESEYRPDREVGGDFFQVLPGDDGSLLIVVGDVSGKGLQAAMTVSAIVGALRGCTVRAPAQVLAYLNGALLGQVSGFFTCCAACIDAEDKLTIANAGHLPPYLNGEELAVASGLPLGISDEIQYEETVWQIGPEDRLTFVSDGVVEARDAHGELFGFARTRDISGKSAGTIAKAAQQFGQEDDITVLTVVRVAAAETVSYHELR